MCLLSWWPVLRSVGVPLANLDNRQVQLAQSGKNRVTGLKDKVSLP